MPSRRQRVVMVQSADCGVKKTWVPFLIETLVCALSLTSSTAKGW